MGKSGRIEEDFLGRKIIPFDALHGINTVRAIENFPISGLKNHPALIKAIAEIKLSAARLFLDFHLLEEDVCKAVIQACEELISGQLLSSIVIDVFQAGAGTSLHMNINEVISNRANQILGKPLGAKKPVHPNDTVNLGQSTNDVIPTAMRIATLRLAKRLIEEAKKFSNSFLKKSKVYKNTIKSGRTHLMDATPITLGAEFEAYAYSIEKDIEFINQAMKNLHFIGLSGTATGSGINAPIEYKNNIVNYLSKTTGLSLKMANSLYEAMQNQADFAHLMGGIKGLALNLIRISNDLRLMSSGPNTGINEIKLPEVQAGSSIMPGKVNPSMLEMLNMVSFYICGMETIVALAVQAGQFELNVFMPIIAHSVLTSIDYLTNAIKATRIKCIEGITVNEDVLKRNAFKSLGIATILNPVIGYENTAKIVAQARRTGKEILEIIKEKKVLQSDEELEKLIIKAIESSS